MFIDNTPASSKWTLAEILTFIIPVGLMLYAKFELIPSEAKIYYYIGGVILLAFAVMVIINPSYVYFNDEDKKNIVLRTCSAFPLFREYREYPFPKTSLKSYQIEDKLFGLQKMLSLTVAGLDPETKQPKEFTIENVNISLLKKENIESLKNALDKYVNK